MTYYQS